MSYEEYTVRVYENRIEWRNEAGQLHRLDGPAIEFADGTKKWYQNDELHRLDGPAVERANGAKVWFQNDKLHRLDGPAVEKADGTKEWWQYGRLVCPPQDSCDGKVVEIDGKKYKLREVK